MNSATKIALIGANPGLVPLAGMSGGDLTCRCKHAYRSHLNPKFATTKLAEGPCKECKCVKYRDQMMWEIGIFFSCVGIILLVILVTVLIVNA